MQTPDGPEAVPPRNHRTQARSSALAAARAGARGQLPPRYPPGYDFRVMFDAYAEPLLQSATSVLDVGAGRLPTFAADRRPQTTTYVGLDLTAAELEAAPPGSYDRFVVADATKYVDELEEQFDLVISWQVLEHVRPLGSAIENLRRYLRPGGHLVAQFSGTFGLFGLLNRCVPDRATPLLLEKLFGRPRQTTFPAYYDRCWASALEQMGAAWSAFDVIPRHEGAGYFAFSRHVQAVYLAYEEWAARSEHRNLASYYLVVARR